MPKCLKCRNNFMANELASLECGAFCENTLDVCGACKSAIDSGKWSRLCAKCGGEPKGLGGGGARRAGRGGQEDNNPSGDNCRRAREGD